MSTTLHQQLFSFTRYSLSNNVLLVFLVLMHSEIPDLNSIIGYLIKNWKFDIEKWLEQVHFGIGEDMRILHVFNDLWSYLNFQIGKQEWGEYESSDQNHLTKTFYHMTLQYCIQTMWLNILVWLILSNINLNIIWNLHCFQVIQKISAIDKDDPPNGHQFYFSLTAEAANNHNFTLQDNKGRNTDVVGKPMR